MIDGHASENYCGWDGGAADSTPWAQFPPPPNPPVEYRGTLITLIPHLTVNLSHIILI